MNHMNVIGRLGADAEIVDGKNGKFVSFRVASDEFVNGKESTSWFRVTMFGDRALKLAEYLKKGRLVSVTGPETVSAYTAKDGTAQVSRDIRADIFDFIKVGGGNANNETKDETITTGTFTKPVEAKADAPTESKSAAEDLPF